MLAGMERRQRGTPRVTGKYALLGDISYELKSSGQISEQPKFLRLQENLKFCAALFNRLFGSKIDLKSAPEIGKSLSQLLASGIVLRTQNTYQTSTSRMKTSESVKIHATGSTIT